MGHDSRSAPDYLEPYARAIAKLGPEFPALLFASRPAQELRFAAMHRLVPLDGRRLADLGCGRADLRTWMRQRGVPSGAYVGVEALADFHAVAGTRLAKRHLRPTALLCADFVAEVDLIEGLVDEFDLDMLIFSGSLNTLDEPDALDVLARSWAALAGRTHACLLFNFLAQPQAGRSLPSTRLPRRDTRRWFAWAFERTPLVACCQHYLGGHDATIAMLVPA